MRIQYIKVDYSVQKFSIEFSYVTPNTRLPHNPTLRVLSYNTRFTILTIEECEDSYSGLSDTLICLTCDHCSSSPHYPKREKKLSLYPTINTLNVYRIFLYLFIFLETIDISRSFLVHALVGSGTTRVLINWSFP